MTLQTFKELNDFANWLVSGWLYVVLIGASVLAGLLFSRRKLKSVKFGPVEVELQDIPPDRPGFWSILKRLRAHQRLRAKRQPKKWWALVKGRIDYWRAREMRAELLKNYKERGIGQNFQDVLKKDDMKFVIPFEDWKSRPALATQSSIVISGPAGVGKTRYLNKLFSECSEEMELVVEISSADLDVAIRHYDDQVFWESILNHFARKRSRDQRSLTPAAIAYGLNTRKCFLVIEDLHNVGPIKNVFPFIKTYFESHHTWSLINLILTTRELIKDRELQLERTIPIVTLEPLKEYEPQEFFIGLCSANKIDVHVSAIGEELTEAFKTPMTSTPLFVVICAWLTAISERTEGSVKRLLQERPGKIYESFITELYNRADEQKSPGYSSFFEAYQAIALRLWPDSFGFTADVINNVLKPVNASFVTPITLQFLTQNGFLFQTQEPFDIPRLAFPHQSIADYLIAKSMVQDNDYRFFGNTSVTTRVEGVLSFLGELITKKESLVALARDELATCMKLLKRNPTLLSRITDSTRMDVVLGIIRAAAPWATGNGSRTVSTATWEQLRSVMGQVHEGRDLLCTEIASYGVSEKAIEAVAIIGGQESVTLLKLWLKQNADLFKKVLRVSYVKDFLRTLLEDFDTKVEDSWPAFKLLYRRDNANDRSVTKAYLQRTVQWLDNARLDDLISGDAGISMLAEACEGLSLDRKRQISSRVARDTDKELIIRGRTRSWMVK